jgi:hypothetical protein
MAFDKIRFDGANVELDYKEPLTGGGERDVTDTGKDPSPAFKRALQAFASYVVWIHSWPDTMVDRLDIRGVTIKRPDDAPRGIIVTALLKCPRARNSTSTINTPYLAQPPENYSGDRTGFLSEAVVGFIDDLEARATEYQNGERGEQTQLPLGDSENSKAAGERMANAEVASTRKPKGKGKNGKPPRQADTGVAIVANEAGEPLDENALRQLLLSVDRDVPVDAIGIWTSSERDAAQRWGEARQKEMTGELATDLVPREPEAVIKYATLPLKADEWTSDRVPPKASDVVAIAGRAD